MTARLRIREIPGAYIGKHCEVVMGGQRVWPPAGKPWKHVSTGSPDTFATLDDTDGVILGTNRTACEAFIAGYEFARAAQQAAVTG